MAVIITETDLTEVERFETLVHPARLRTTDVDPAVRAMHIDSGLWAALAAQPTAERRSVADVDALLLALLQRTADSTGMFALAGSGIARFDRPWLAHCCPSITPFLVYYEYDVSSVRRFTRDIAGLAWPGSDPAIPHRAMNDIEACLSDARVWRAWLRERAEPA